MNAKATVHGAVSLVNAIATGRGATLGISLTVTATVRTSPGSGITVAGTSSKRLIKAVVERIVPQKKLRDTAVRIELSSKIPSGYGLKSSSAISTAVAMASAKAFGIKASDRSILLAGVNASISAGVSITGAYDDAAACYYGGFAVTNNKRRQLVVSKKAPRGLSAVIFVPTYRKRGNPKKLADMKLAFAAAWSFAKSDDYWNAMILNGLAAATTLRSNPGLVSALVRAGALGASVSGNGPAIAAVAKSKDIAKIKRVFTPMKGSIITSRINNCKAHVCQI